MGDELSVLIVDDNALLRMGLAEALSDEDDMRLAGEASNGIEAVDMYRELKPTVVIMDYRMPFEDGVDATRKITSEFPDAKIILLSVYEGEEDIWNAWRAGASGYLSKTEAAPVFLESIRSVAGGGTYFPAEIARKLEARKAQSTLTAREMDVLRLIVDGQTNKEIMESLHVSASTVKLHISNMLEKLGVSDRTQAAIAAVKRGIIHLQG